MTTLEQISSAPNFLFIKRIELQSINCDSKDLKKTQKNICSLLTALSTSQLEFLLIRDNCGSLDDNCIGLLAKRKNFKDI